MHAQNTQFIDIFGALGQSLEQFRATLQMNNDAIMKEISNLSKSSNHSANHHTSRGNKWGDERVDVNNWWYVHSDGVKRRVPPSWTFPHGTLKTMYILWHCGDHINSISPMKLFNNRDVDFLGKRAKTNRIEVKHLMKIIDKEAACQGNAPTSNMTPIEKITIVH